MAQELAVVTGGAGFIGSHIVDLLLGKGYRVRVIDNLIGGRRENLDRHARDPALDLVEMDVRNCKPSDSLFSGARIVIHMAGVGDIVPSIEQPSEYMSANTMGTVAALECARAAEVSKFVYAASSSCYGLASVPTDENHPIAPIYPYALSKYLGEQSVLHWGKVYDLPVVSLRIFNAYGPRSRTSGAYGAVFGVFLKQKLAGRPFTVVGDGTQSRDFLFATDVANAFVMAAESDVTGDIFNLGAGNPQSVNRLVELLGGDVVHIPKRPGEPDCTYADISKIRSSLGWAPRVSFEEGVAAVLEEIDYWKDAPLWTEASIQDATQKWFQYLS